MQPCIKYAIMQSTCQNYSTWRDTALLHHPLAYSTSMSRVLGWTPNNEISNGRWVMFGLLIGMLTEYGTGVDFVDQIKLMLTYMGIADMD